MVALRRGLMLLISASLTSASAPLVHSSPSLTFSSLCLRSSCQQQQQYQHPVGSAGRRIGPSSAFQKTSASPSFAIHTLLVNSRSIFHEPLATERRGLEAIVEGFRAEYIRASEKRLRRKTIPVFGLSESPKWSERRPQRNGTPSVGNGHGNIWEGVGGVISWRAYSNSANATQRAGDGLEAVKQSRERENEDQRRSASNQEDLKSSIGTASSGLFVQAEGNGGRSHVSERPPSINRRADHHENPAKSRERDGSSSQASGRPPFKPKANYYEKRAESRGEGNGRSSQVKERPPFKPKANYYEKRAESRGEGEGRSSQVKERPPFKPKANYYEKRAESKGEGDGRRSQAKERPPFKPKANYYEKRAESRGEGDWRTSQASGRPPFKPKANHYDKLPQSRVVGDGGGPQARGGPPFKPKANYYDKLENPRKTIDSDNMGQTERGDRNSHPGKFYRAQNGESPKSRDENSGEGPHYGYKFRETGAKLGQFRRIGPQERSSAVGDGQVQRGQLRESGAVRGQSSPGSNGTNSSTPNQNSSKEVGEVKKYPPRRLEGEKKWQYAVRKKQLRLAGHTRGSRKKIAPQFVDDEQLGNEPQGDDWRRKKTAWLCKQIPNLRPRPIVTILNEQRKWIKAEDTKYVIEHLLQIDQTLRSHRVMKWEMQQPWYEFDFELSSKVAVQLGQNNKLSRTRDIYDLIIKNGKVPNFSTYEVLINCYIVDGENAALVQAWSLYNQMSQLGGHEPPPTLTYNLFQGLVQKGLTFLDQADELFKRIKTSGLVCSTEMYSSLMNFHGTNGNNDRVDDLIKEMKETGLPVGPNVYAAILRSCAKDGNVAEGEQAFADLKRTGHKLTPSVFSSLIKMYGKAGLPEKAFQAFEEMRETGTSPNLTVYEPLIEVAVLSGNRQQAEELLQEAQKRGTQSLHGCYNSIMELYSKQGLLDEVERLFNEMESKGYPPNQASFNVLLEAYVRHQLVEKAEAVYENMKQSGKAKPNVRTYELLIKLYGEGKSSQKLKEVFKELADKKLEVPEEARRYLEAAVSPKQLEAHRITKFKLEKEQREILVGVLLAGAGVETHNRNRTYQIHFGLDPDSEVGFPLINHLYREFSDWAVEPPKRQPLPDPKNPKRSKMLLAFQTVSHGSFRFFAHQYRSNLSPVIPRLVHRWLTPRALAYWYMYGGNKCPETGDILLNASAYTDKEIMLVVNALKTRTIDCEKKKTSSGLAICFNGRSAIWLWGLMEPFILPELKASLQPEDDQGGGDLVQL